jgi:hypothetical protein
MKDLTPQEELIIIDDMILDFQRKKFRAKTEEDKQQYTDILKGIYDMKEVRKRQVEVLEAYDKIKVA